MTDPNDQWPVFLDLTNASYVEKTSRELNTDSGQLPFWGDNPKAWDTVFIGGRKVPGICRVQGKVARRHERKKISGKHGATFAFTGEDPTEISIKVQVWTQEQLGQYAELMRFLRTLKPRQEKVVVGYENVVVPEDSGGFSTAWGPNHSGGASFNAKTTKGKPIEKNVVRISPVTLIHPAVAVFGVSHVLVVGFSLLEPKGVDGSGVYEASIECVEYIPEEIREKGGVTAPQKTSTKISSIGEGAIGKAPSGPAGGNTGVGF